MYGNNGEKSVEVERRSVLKERLARPRTAGYLGPRGTFTEEAAAAYRARLGESTPLEAYPDIPSLLRAADRGELAWVVVPIENSFEGTVPITVDMLVHEITAPICGEVVLSVRHHLLASGPISFAEVHTVMSHPQALAQCRGWLESNVPNARLVTASSTAEAARRVSEAEAPGTAAIGTAAAGELYGLHTLARDIQDSEENQTRFVAVARPDAGGCPRPEPTGRDKTSIVFAFPVDRPGNLHRALGIFAERGINLSKLESRPARKALGRYLFLVDLEGHMDDEVVSEALGELKPLCAFFKVLGSYPQAPAAV